MRKCDFSLDDVDLRSCRCGHDLADAGKPEFLNLLKPALNSLPKIVRCSGFTLRSVPKVDASSQKRRLLAGRCCVSSVSGKYDRSIRSSYIYYGDGLFVT